MLTATSDGSAASSPRSLSAGGQDEQPWLVNNSRSARGWPALARVLLIASKPTMRNADAARRYSISISTPAGPPMWLDRGPLISGERLIRHSIRGAPPRQEDLISPKPHAVHRVQSRHVTTYAARRRRTNCNMPPLR